MTTALKDPVCHMDIVPAETTEKSEYGGEMYYFCCSGCRQSFDREPERYVGQVAPAHAHGCC